ncbi:hypothetical protein ACB288_21470 [Aeromonas taiwanensis]|uniref:Uncharacterized protein n=2 Tax=Aeromonas TaxID=642 RepID=A0AAW7I6Y4_9GAMM|nr:MULTISPECIES: hypothetical protein [Aeromonas]MCE9968427.1 hypothetical protein [Aeromonas salmonicida]MDM5070000.1 hypothetical protein [Aeromonas salmonicida]MDM5116398.1 hypothetical protein [Aeromonas salmonicida]MDM5141966.1 hypothetical protein [Aeromonas bestiarum]
MRHGPTIKDIAKAHADVIPGWVITIFICMTAAIVRLACGLDYVWQHDDLVGFISLWSIPWLIAVVGVLVSLSHNVEINERARDICGFQN